MSCLFSTLNVMICMEASSATLSTYRFFSIHPHYAPIRSSCIYEDVNYPFEDDLYSEITLNCVEPRKGRCVKTFYESSLICLVLTDTENMTSHKPNDQAEPTKVEH